MSWNNHNRTIAMLLAAVVLVLLSATRPAGAATYVVNVNYDFQPPSVDGICDTSECTLREAVEAALATPDADTSTFAAGLTGLIQLRSPLPSFNSNTTITGPGANILGISGKHPSG